MQQKNEMEHMAQTFFMNLYQADQSVNPDELLHLFQPQITEEMNVRTLQELLIGRNRQCIVSGGPLKVPGPDGFPDKFFQRNWETIHGDIIKGVQNFFDIGVMLAGINDMAIVLISKKEEPELLKYFRPISLYNVVYKIMSKCLVNRLHPLLNELIADTQSAFIPGRLITNNALIAFKCLHAIKHGSKKCKGFGAYKLDLAKAYDRVDWRFLEGALKRLGFQSKWV
jgi:hypothetical protein